MYSWAHDEGHCSSCVLSCTSKEAHGVLVVKPWKHWSKSTQDLTWHNESLFHKEAQVAADHFKTMVENPARSIEGVQKENAKEEGKENLKTLKSIIACVLFLGQLGMAPRGDDESPDSSTNRGHFPELLEVGAATEPILRMYLTGRSKNATYCSPEIQNELIFICATESRSLIVDEVKEAKFFSIIAGEVSDTPSCSGCTISWKIW